MSVMETALTSCLSAVRASPAHSVLETMVKRTCRKARAEIRRPSSKESSSSGRDSGFPSLLLTPYVHPCAAGEQARGVILRSDREERASVDSWHAHMGRSRQSRGGERRFARAVTARQLLARWAYASIRWLALGV